MNFNLNLQVDKVMNKLSSSKVLRVWTYIMAFVFLIGILIWQAAPILTATSKLIEVLK
ncbi:Uncharacterised protein [Acinetobacter baumannii]|uniref:hypothetical protein n=1 Tax=unclassified Acinetobacter TaxID=196816 RepID=UPI000314835D|nr:MULTISPECIES: hypothetical protein [unclassified Acinetobacter]EXB85482.1 hypothetical protein J542_0579 [Acinetobacter baumannii 299505]SSI68854.1 Uncharacterised protein [Acinetobacter baumannii]MEB3793661.1 hypothetical protein [Acinetobacter sp. IK24]MEB3812969.1 hypothetical protein [Acinetobacter sp. IK22]MEB3832057.1 hypothetical protein [Acinetobacter sp. IK23]